MSLGNPSDYAVPPLPPPIYGPPNPPPLPAPAAVRTKLVTSPTQKFDPLPYAEVDTHLAVTTGLAEYLSQLSREGPGGNILRFKGSYAQWQEPEQRALYPSVAVYSQETGNYDASSQFPSIAHVFEPPAQGGPGSMRQALVKRAEYVQELMVDVWTTEPGERTGLVLMVEEALSPVEWMYGLRLYLPFYYGQVMVITPHGMRYVEEEVSQLRRERRSVILVTAQVSAMSLVTLPVGVPRVQTSVSS